MTVELALLTLRLGVGLTFGAHGAQKVFGWWGGPGMTGWTSGIAAMGYRPARFFAGASALIELVGGLLLAVGLLTPLVSAALVAHTVVIIGQAHWRNGFFNSASGFEFPLLLGLSSVAIGLAGPGTISADALIGFRVAPAVAAGLLVVGFVAGLTSLAVPRLVPRLVHRGWAAS